MIDLGIRSWLTVAAPNGERHGWRLRAAIVEHCARWLLPICVAYGAVNLLLSERIKWWLVDKLAGGCKVPGGLCSLQVIGKTDGGDLAEYGLSPFFTVYSTSGGSVTFGLVPLLLVLATLFPLMALVFFKPWLLDRARVSERCQKSNAA